MLKFVSFRNRSVFAVFTGLLRQLFRLSPLSITLAFFCFSGALLFLQDFNYYLIGYTHGTDRHRAAFWADKITQITGRLDQLERFDYDLQLTHLRRRSVHPNVAMVEINERSILALGQFPFARSVYKTFLEKVEEAGAKVVALDITFSERERNALNEMKAFREDLIQKEGFDSRAVKMIEQRIFAIDSDEDLANALNRAKIPVVLGFAFASEESSEKMGDVKPNAEVRAALADFRVKANGVSRFDASGKEIPLIESVTSMDGRLPVVNMLDLMRSLNKRSSIGLFNPEADEDSVIRRTPMVLAYDNNFLGSLSLEAVAAFYGESPVYDVNDGLSIRGLPIDPAAAGHPGRLHVPLSPWGEMLIRYYGGAYTFPPLEFSDVVLGKLSAPDLRKAFAGKIVFVGATAVGLKDIRATPFAKDFPGVEVHATVASNILSRTFLVQDERYFLAGYLFILVFGSLVAWSVYRLQPLWSFAITICSLGTLIYLSHGIFDLGIVVPTVLPATCCLLVFFGGVVYRYFSEEREKKMVRRAFSRYVSGAVVEEILKDQTKLCLSGQKKELSVMFVDLIDFTSLSERMEATFVTQILNEYFTRMTKIILRNHGTLDKYMGDGIMCFWGAPLDLPDHARLACVTALEMRQELTAINREWRATYGIAIDLRIGIHTGDMAVGNMGSDQVFSYTVMGDNVNLAARLEGVNTVYGTNVVVSASTAARSGGSLLFRPLDRVQVKGKVDSVEILELVGPRSAKEPEWVHAFRVGLTHYQRGEWDDAESAFGACLTLKPDDGPSQVFVDRIRDFRIVEPDEWLGVWKLSSK